MESFKFYAPTEIVFGKDAERYTAELIKQQQCSKVLIVYGGGSVKSTGLLERITNQLTEAGLTYIVRGGVKPNPVVSFVTEVREQALVAKVDFVLAIGGGSVIDTAKAIALGLQYPEYTIWDIWQNKVEVTKTTPMGSILTLAAAGSETSDSSVLTNEATGQKRGKSHRCNRPLFAIMNPELTYTAPKYQKACGIADIFMHTLERYFAKEKDNFLTDYIAEGVLRDVILQGPKMLADSTDYVAHSEIMYASTISHNDITGLGRTKDFTVHKFGHELSGKFDVTHGASLTTIWPHWAQYVYHLDVERFAHLGNVLFGIEDAGETGAIATIRRIQEFFSSLGLPTSIPELLGSSAPETELEYLAAMCTDNNTKTIGYFKPLTYSDVLAIYKLANR